MKLNCGLWILSPQNSLETLQIKVTKSTSSAPEKTEPAWIGFGCQQNNFVIWRCSFLVVSFNCPLSLPRIILYLTHVSNHPWLSFHPHFSHLAKLTLTYRASSCTMQAELANVMFTRDASREVASPQLWSMESNTAGLWSKCILQNVNTCMFVFNTVSFRWQFSAS